MYAAAVIDARRYPFLVDPVEYLERRYGVSPLVLASRARRLVELGLERLGEAVRKNIVPPPRGSVEEELGGFLYAALLALASGSRWLVSRLALSEAERAYRFLLEEPDELLAQIARRVGLRSVRFAPGLYREPAAVVGTVPVYTEYNFAVSFLEYVAVGKRLIGGDEWRPSNLPVKRGLVYLDKPRMARLAKEAINAAVEGFINSLAERFRPEEAAAALREYLGKVAELQPRRAAGSGSAGGWVPKGVIDEEAFPPCMREILERARRGEHLSHHERFAIATFLLNIGADVDTVVDVFRSMPDFKEKITRYQVEHLAGLRGSGKKYKTYSCEKMRTLGLCRGECGTRTPLQAYYRALRAKLRRRGRAPKEQEE